MNDIGPEIRDQPVYLRIGETDRKLTIGQGRDRVNCETRVRFRGPGRRANDDCFVPLGAQKIKNLEHAVRHSVDGGKKALAHNDDSHNQHLNRSRVAQATRRG